MSWYCLVFYEVFLQKIKEPMSSNQPNNLTKAEKHLTRRQIRITISSYWLSDLSCSFAEKVNHWPGYGKDTSICLRILIGARRKPLLEEVCYRGAIVQQGVGGRPYSFQAEVNIVRQSLVPKNCWFPMKTSDLVKIWIWGLAGLGATRNSKFHEKSCPRGP